MKVFVTGVAGQLGHDVMNELNKRGYEAIGSDLAPEYQGANDHTAIMTLPYVSLDITDETEVNRVIEDVQPDAVIHCAAWTAVDAAEDEENKEKVYAINVKGTEYIAKACKVNGAKMMYISTDYVFSVHPKVQACVGIKKQCLTMLTMPNTIQIHKQIQTQIHIQTQTQMQMQTHKHLHLQVHKQKQPQTQTQTQGKTCKGRRLALRQGRSRWPLRPK